MRTREFYEALAYAARAHAGARYGDLEYWLHPLAVADTLYEHGIREPDTLVAALLHDVVEDTDATVKELEARFGAAVARVVAEVTDAPGPKPERAERQLAHAAGFSLEAVAVKAADRLVNLSDLGRVEPDAARVAHSRRLHDALRARSETLNGGAAHRELLDALDGAIRGWEARAGG